MTRPVRAFLALFVTVLLGGCAHDVSQGSSRDRDAASKETGMRFSFRVYDAVTIRANPTTQVGITIDGWPDNTFVLWFPEVVGDLWQQWNPAVAHQNFTTTDRGGLRWTYDGNPAASIQSELTPQSDSLLLETRVTNHGQEDLKLVYAQNCIHFSQAPGFICDDYSRFYIRSAGQWRSLASLKPTSAFPRYYREAYPSRGRIDPTEHQFGDIRQEAPVDHPLMVLVSQDGKHAVGVASEHYEFLFHNQMEYLRCIHSEQGCLPALPAGQTAVFREKIYFVEGGVKECVAAFEKDVQGNPAGEFSFRD